MSGVGYAVLCVVAPAAWGLVMVYAFRALERRRRRPSKDDPPPVDYSI